MRRFLALTVIAFAAPAQAACTSATEPGDRTMTLQVSESRRACTGEGTFQCLQVREHADAPFTLFYGAIEGFAYEPGYRYTILVSVRAIPYPPLDGSTLVYRLLTVMSKTPVTAAN
ncbi:MAG: hypothetical protein JWM95_5072 [Gemmatimonadetes bacterium]|nr:hypothetical protein [Gemmatimonadota bacterium]